MIMRFPVSTALLWSPIVAMALLTACQTAPPVSLDGVDARHYDLAIQLDPATREFRARLLLEVHHPDTLQALPLAFEPLDVDTVRVNGTEVVARQRGNALWVPLTTGHAVSTVEVVYQGWPSKGFYTASHGPQPVIYTDSWPDEGRGWLPGVHHPSDPATWTLTLTLPRGYEAVASGTEQALDTLGAKVRYRWRLNEPAPLYTFAFAVADFSLTEATVGDTLPVRYYMLAEDSAYAGQLRRTPQALAFFSERIGPYPFEGYASVQVPLRYAGMENTAAAFLMADLFRIQQAEAVQVHELAHQWFGNRVTLANWADLWLSEGMATYLTTLFYEQADGLDEARRRWVDMAALTSARPSAPTALVAAASVPPAALLTWVPYDKGGSVLHLLRHTLGDDAFFTALRSTYQRYATQPLSTPAFRQELEAASGRDLAAFFDYWVYSEALPTLATSWDPATSTLSWQITGDAGLLADVPFELQLSRPGHVDYVDVRAGQAVLSKGGSRRPRVRPVGVMMRVE